MSIDEVLRNRRDQLRDQRDRHIGRRRPEAAQHCTVRLEELDVVEGLLRSAASASLG